MGVWDVLVCAVQGFQGVRVQGLKDLKLRGPRSLRAQDGPGFKGLRFRV